MDKLREELTGYRTEFGFQRRRYCGHADEKEYRNLEKENEPLPDGVFRASDGSHYIMEYSDLSDDEKTELLRFRELYYLRTTKNCVVFFVVIYVLYEIVTLLYSIQGFK